MALDKDSLKSRYVSEMQALGFKTDGEHAWAAKLAKALANATVDEIQSNAKAKVSGGSSAGLHPIE